MFLKEKVDAGAAAIITQLFFDNGDFFRFADDLAKLGVTVPIVPGILPILSASQVRRFTSLCGSKIPAALERELTKVENDDAGAVALGIDYATRQCEGLIQFGVRGLHFYSLNKSHSVQSICTNLAL
jgi:methylenetetrahydrofolate reductase (NADPH)